MTNTQSKYHNTALLMNQALLELLDKKEYEYITIKEICTRAGVNRSTFYLHYDSISDLLAETIEYFTKTFLQYFPITTDKFFDKLRACSKDELILITPQYLTPYLTFIKENSIVYKVAAKHNILLNSVDKFQSLYKCIFRPIFLLFGIDDKISIYMIQYYLNGINAIINEWIKADCKEPIEVIEDIIIRCIRPQFN